MPAAVALLGHEIPAAESTRPFSRTSTVEELSAGVLGKLLAAVMRRELNKLIPEDDDGTLAQIMGDVVVSMPLRGFVAMRPGLPIATLDRIIDALNGHWIRAIRSK